MQTSKQVLEQYKLSYRVLAKNLIEVTFKGHFDDNYADLEAALTKSGLQALSRKYDKKNNQTITVYRSIYGA